MTRASHADDPEARRLREAIAAELIALRQAFAFRPRVTTTPGGDIGDQVGKDVRARMALNVVF